MNIIYDVEKSLDTLQDNVIGLFRNHRVKDDYELVVRNEDGWLKVVSIGKLAGMNVNHITSDQGKLVMFDNGQSLAEMKKNPFRLQELVDEVKK